MTTEPRKPCVRGVRAADWQSVRSKAPKSVGADIEPRLAAIVESSNDPVIGKDLSGRVFAWNKAAERLFGYTAQEMIGHSLTTIFPANRISEEASILAAIARDEKVEHCETTQISKDGFLVRVTATISPIGEFTDRITDASSITCNATERDKYQQRIQELQTELAHVQRITELGQVVSKLVHEVNQPITALNNYLNACRRLLDSGSQAGIRTALDRMGGQIDRTAEIVQRMHDYMKTRDVQVRSERLSSVIHEAVALTKWSLQGDQLALTVQVEPEDQEAVIDRIQVQQVLFNLMRNSVEAMQKQPRRELILAARHVASGMVEISVADTGPGLPEVVRNRLFQPFVTTKPQGLGVGLSVCHDIVQLHGGRMWADENIDGGTVFRFTVKSAEGIAVR